MFTKGDVVKDPPPRKEDLEIEQNLILPPDVNPYRPVHQYHVKVFKAEGILLVKKSAESVFWSLEISANEKSEEKSISNPLFSIVAIGEWLKFISLTKGRLFSRG